MRGSCALTTLDLRDNRLDAAAAKTLAVAIADDEGPVTSLNLSSNRLCNIWIDYETRIVETRGQYDSYGVRALAKALERNTSLTSLSLELNHLGTEGGRAMTRALKTNTTLKQCSLGANDLDRATEAQLQAVLHARSAKDNNVHKDQFAWSEFMR
jgi:Ran GTPase-activating protein (RanGAP) involved in mRNA processing and transport